MKATTKFRYLSRATATRILAWCQQHEDHPLSKAYMASLLAFQSDPDPQDALWNLYTYTYSEFADRLEPIHGIGKTMAQWRKIYDAQFQHRDTVGRIILDVIKREQHGKKTAADSTDRGDSGGTIRPAEEGQVGQGRSESGAQASNGSKSRVAGPEA
jgi:hypothetical protein